MYFGTGGTIPKQLEAARQAARKSRMEANGKTCCPTCDPMRRITKIAEEGLEGAPFSSVKEPLFHHDGAKSGAVPDDLLWVIEAWPHLESKIRKAVVALVTASFNGPKNDSSGKSSDY
jgi:hypothetical protein